MSADSASRIQGEIINLKNAMEFFDKCSSNYKGDVSKTTVAATATTSCFQYESSCSVVLDESGIKNLGCVPCYWKERIEAMCYPSVNEGLHHCCCRTPNCNKRVRVLHNSKHLSKGVPLRAAWNPFRTACLRPH